MVEKIKLIWILFVILLIAYFIPSSSANSWIVGQGGNAWSGNSSITNMTLNRDTNNIELRQQVDDYVSYWRFDNHSSNIMYDENTTSNNNGIWIWFK